MSVCVHVQAPSPKCSKVSKVASFSTVYSVVLDSLSTLVCSSVSPVGSPDGGQVSSHCKPSSRHCCSFHPAGSKQTQSSSSSPAECTFRLSSLVSAKVSVSVCRYIVLQCELIMQGHTLVSPGVTRQDR